MSGKLVNISIGREIYPKVTQFIYCTNNLLIFFLLWEDRIEYYSVHRLYNLMKHTLAVDWKSVKDKTCLFRSLTIWLVNIWELWQHQVWSSWSTGTPWSGMNTTGPSTDPFPRLRASLPPIHLNISPWLVESLISSWARSSSFSASAPSLTGRT